MGIKDEILGKLSKWYAHPHDPEAWEIDMMAGAVDLILPLVKRAQAEALRDVAGRFVLTVETDLWDEGFNEGLNVVLAHADRIEKEAGA